MLRMITSIDQIAYALNRFGKSKLNEDQLEALTTAARRVSIRMFNFTGELSDEWNDRYPPVNGPEVMKRNNMTCRCGLALTLETFVGYGLFDQSNPPTGDNVCLLCRVCAAKDDGHPILCLQCNTPVPPGRTSFCGAECINAFRAGILTA